MLTDQIDLKFSCSYSWLSVIPGSSSQKCAVYSRAYINFHKAEDVILSLPNSSMVMFLSMKQQGIRLLLSTLLHNMFQSSGQKKDGREGTLFKGKPIEHLPNAEIQLERREYAANWEDYDLLQQQFPDSCAQWNLHPLRSSPSIETSERLVKSIRQPERLIQLAKVEKDRQLQTSNVLLSSKSRNGVSDDKISANDIQVAKKSARRVRNKERPDHVVWTPLRRLDGLHASDESSSSSSQSISVPPPSSEGSPIYVSRRRLPHGEKDADGTVPGDKSTRRGVSSRYNSHEKQVWVQKSSTSF